MNVNVKIIGAGSIGNHLAQAARRMGWSVCVVDKDEAALDRMKNDIYPKRYGAWDDAIKLYKSGSEPKGGFDLICIGTPPHIRIPIAIEMLKENPKVLQLEKPLCQPDTTAIQSFIDAYKNSSPKPHVIMGYDHALSPAITHIVEMLAEKSIGDAITLDVEFREHWKGIFAAHPWLSGPQDSYLGFTSKGGGASGEHSHALHLWHFLASKAGLGEWQKVSAVLAHEKTEGIEYDSIASFVFVTDKGKVGRVIQDVITHPPKKWLRVQGNLGYIEWHCNGSAEGDFVRYDIGKGIVEKVFPKKRVDDFFAEMKHVGELLEGKVKPEDSPVSIQSGLAVMSVLASINGNDAHGIDIKKFSL